MTALPERTNKEILSKENILSEEEFARAACCEFNSEFNSWGTDPEKLIKLIECVASVNLGGLVRETYKTLYNEDLIEELMLELPMHGHIVKKLTANGKFLEERNI